MKASIQDEGTIVLFRPLDDEAHDWVESNVSYEDWAIFGPSLAIEHRYADALIDGFINDGGEIADE